MSIHLLHSTALALLFFRSSAAFEAWTNPNFSTFASDVIQNGTLEWIQFSLGTPRDLWFASTLSPRPRSPGLCP